MCACVVVLVQGPPRSAVEVPFSIVPVNGAPYIRLLSNVIQNAYVDVSQYTYFTYRAVGNAQVRRECVCACEWPQRARGGCCGLCGACTVVLA